MRIRTQIKWTVKGEMRFWREIVCSLVTGMKRVYLWNMKQLLCFFFIFTCYKGSISVPRQKYPIFPLYRNGPSQCFWNREMRCGTEPVCRTGVTFMLQHKAWKTQGLFTIDGKSSFVPWSLVEIDRELLQFRDGSVGFCDQAASWRSGAGIPVGTR
jgi:hypothetical protein